MAIVMTYLSTEEKDLAELRALLHEDKHEHAEV